MDAALHLIDETSHDAVNDNQCRNAQCHTDDRGERNKTSLEVSPRQQQFVHPPVLGRENMNVILSLSKTLAFLQKI